MKKQYTKAEKVSRHNKLYNYFIPHYRIDLLGGNYKKIYIFKMIKAIKKELENKKKYFKSYYT